MVFGVFFLLLLVPVIPATLYSSVSGLYISSFFVYGDSFVSSCSCGIRLLKADATASCYVCSTVEYGNEIRSGCRYCWT